MKSLIKCMLVFILLGLFASKANAFSGNWNYSWGDTKPSSVDIGTSVNRTCFLSGFGGDLTPMGAYLFSFNEYPAAGGVRKKANGNYELYVQPRPGSPIIAYARCVNSSLGRVEASTTTYGQNSSGDKTIDRANGRRQCFLQDIQNYGVHIYDSSGATYSFGWGFADKNSPDEVRVFNNGYFWKLHLSSVHRYPVNIHASAVCIDANEFDGEWLWGVGDPGTGKYPLTNVLGATCGLSGVRGYFNASDWNNAAYIDSVTGLFFITQFRLNLANGKNAWASCMK